MPNIFCTTWIRQRDFGYTRLPRNLRLTFVTKSKVLLLHGPDLATTSSLTKQEHITMSGILNERKFAKLPLDFQAAVRRLDATQLSYLQASFSK